MNQAILLSDLLLYLIVLPFAFWVLVNLKTSRSDGTLIKKLHPFRKVTIVTLKNRLGSQVYLEHRVNIEPLLQFVSDYQSTFPITVNHCFVAAMNKAIAENPVVNSFVMGDRLYQRNERAITFAVKKIKRNRKADLGMVKLVMQDDESFLSLARRISAAIERERMPKPTPIDSEMKLLSLIPTPVFHLIMSVGSWLNHKNLLPNFIIKNDVLHTSALLANLGSVPMPSAFHHLFEFGSCPIFITAGEIEDHAFIEEGQVIVRKSLPIKFTFDQRVTDGLNAWETIKSGLETLAQPSDYFLADLPAKKLPSVDA